MIKNFINWYNDNFICIFGIQSIIVLIYFVFGGMISSKYIKNRQKKKTKEVLNLYSDDFEKHLDNKIREINYEEIYKERYDLFYKAGIYGILFLLGFVKIVTSLIINDGDTSSISIDTITIIIAVIECRDNCIMYKSKCKKCEELESALSDFIWGEMQKKAKAITEKIIRQDTTSIGAVEKYIERFGNKNIVKKVSIYNQNGKCISKGKVNIEIKIVETSFLISFFKIKNRQMKYLPKSISSDNYGGKIQMKQDVLEIEHFINEAGKCIIKIQ